MAPQHFAAFNVEKQVFLRTTLSCCLVNLKPIVPGHVLVIPRRVVSRFSELSAAEVGDLYTTVQRVARVLNTRCYQEMTATTVSMQDGVHAGQTVPHVHVHVLPRGRGDMEALGRRNDDVYRLLDDHSEHLGDDLAAWQKAAMERAPFNAVDDESRHPRTMQQMEEEAAWLAEAFKADDEASNSGDLDSKIASKA